MGIEIKSNTKLKASLKLLNQINTFLFEQEYGELKDFTAAQIKKIKEASITLSTVINKNSRVI